MNGDPRGFIVKTPDTRLEAFPSHRSLRARPLRARRGSIAVYAAVTSIVLVGVVGLAIDTAYAMTARAQLQRAADAAALAGAAKLGLAGQSNFDLVRQAALDNASRNVVVGCCPTGVLLDSNPGNDPAGDVVVGRWQFDATTHTFFFDPTGVPADAVQVRARCAEDAQNPPLQLLFGPIFGHSTSQGGRPAIARLAPPPDPLLLVLNSNRAGAFLINGGATVNIDAGFLQIDSTDACGLRINGGSGTVSGMRINIVGGSCAGSGLLGDVIEGAPYVPDPLAGVPEPDVAALGLASMPAITSAGTYSPGYYPGGIDLSGGTAHLEPGIYVIGNQSPGRGVNLTGSGFVEGDGVMIFLEDGARLRTSGTDSGMRLTPPASGTYAGISLFQARSNNQAAIINGGGLFDIGGTMYLASGALSIAGNPGRHIGRVIVDTFDISGNGTFLLDGRGVPPTTNPRSVYLVR